MKNKVPVYKIFYRIFASLIPALFLIFSFTNHSPGLAQAGTVRWVTSAADTGIGTLREALQNAQTGDTILFSNTVFPVTNPTTILLGNELFLTGSGIILDGSDAGVILNGSGLPSGYTCLVIQNASSITIRGLQFVSCKNNGIEVRGNVAGLTIGGSRAVGSGPVGQGNRFANNQRAVWADADNLSNFTIQGNLVGTSLDGSSANGNLVTGMTLKRVTGLTVGGSEPGLRNLFSGNAVYGLEIWDSSNVVIENNYIGTNNSGTSAIGNGNTGVFVIRADTLTLKNNLISGNQTNGGYFEDAVHMTVQGNTIGTNIAGTVAIGNGDNGLVIKGDDILVGGGAVGAGNLISGNNWDGGWAGLEISNEDAIPSNVTVQGNLVGVNRSGTDALPNAGTGIYIGGSNLVLGGYSPGEGNHIAGNGANGVTVEKKNTAGVTMEMVGNTLGTDTTGSRIISNGSYGAIVTGITQATVLNNLMAGSGGNGWAGLHIQGNGAATSTAIIQNNMIGVDRTASFALPNEKIGLYVQDLNVTIGGSQANQGNVISANKLSAMEIQNQTASFAFTAMISGNFVGTDRTGALAMGNSSDGIFIRRMGAVRIEHNLISSNGNNGINIDGDSLTTATICDNKIGTDVTGKKDFGNHGNGIWSQNASLAIGDGQSCLPNLISGNDAEGIATRGNSTLLTIIKGNKIGTDISGQLALGQTGDGVWAEGNNLIFGGPNNSDANLVSGNAQSGLVIKNTQSAIVQNNRFGTDLNGTEAVPNAWNGVVINSAQNVQIIQNLISGNGSVGLSLEEGSNNNVITGNYIGVDISGTAPLGNNVGIGVYNGAGYNLIGGDNAAERNIISANQNQGVSIGGVYNILKNNYIGTDLTGKARLANGAEGASLHVPDNKIQGYNQVINNLISGNNNSGLTIYGDYNIVQGNIIGMDVTGKTALSNVAHGIYVSGLGNLIGGTTSAQRNNVAGNGYNGILLGVDRENNGAGSLIRKATSNKIQNNFIGTDITGLKAIPNGWSGIFLSGESNTVGGSMNSEGNLISGNSHEGIVLGEASLTKYNLVQGNKVGTDVTGEQPLPNGDTGIGIWGGVGNNTIGGSTADKGNIVAYNHDLGIAKWKDDINGEGTGNVISYNQIHNNEGVGLKITVNTTLAENNIHSNGENRIEIPAGTIQGSSQAWTVQGKANAYFVHYDCSTCDLVVSTGTTLTLGSGVHLYMDYNRTLRVQGKLAVQGETDNMVHISGPRDSIWAGDWKGIVFAPGSQGELNYAEVSFAQVGLDISGTVSLSNSTISANRTGGIWVHNAGSISLSNNTLSGNFADTYNSANNAYDIRNETGTRINAQNTWWGWAGGPSSSKIIGLVDTSNWRTTESATNTWQSAELVTEGSHSFSISGQKDLDWYRIPIMEGNRTLHVTIKDLPVDYDLFLFGQLGNMAKETEGIARRIRHISRMMDTEETETVDQLDDIARIMHIGQYSSDSAGLDTDLNTGELLRASTNRGARMESIDFDVGNQVGWYYILVAGNNGAFSSQPYKLEVTTSYQRALGPENYYVPVFPPITGVYNKTTLILVNRNRLISRYEQQAVDAMLAKAQALADNPLVNGQVVDVSNCNALYNGWNDCNKMISDIYADWDKNPTSIYYANRVAATVKSLIGALRTSYPQLKYLVLIGNDSILPFWRAMDETPLANEATYPGSSLPAGPVQSALSKGYFLTDDYFSSFETIAWHGRELYLPAYRTGRLVETPAQITAVMDAFVQSPQSPINSALVTGYDFLTDQANRISSELSPIPTTNLINDNWTTEQLSQAWFTASPAKFVSLNAHFTHYRATPGNLDDQSPLLPGNIQTSLENAQGSLVYSVGCHSGLSVPNSTVAQSTEFDFAQVFAEKGITYIANSGFGYGDRASIGYSEVLSLLFLKKLETNPAVGDALAEAKNAYFQETGAYSFSPYDEKSLEEVILYGLPMQQFGFPLNHQSVNSSSALQEQPCSLTPAQDDTGLTAQRLSCSLNTDLTTTDRGSFYSLEGQTEVNIGQPVQPKLGVKISLPGELAHGAFFESGTYLTDYSFNPVITSVVTDGVSDYSTEPTFTRSAWTPSSWDIINSIRTPDGLSQSLVVIPAQYQSISGITGTERVFQNMQYTVYYSDSEDSLPPFVWSVDIKNNSDKTAGIVRLVVFDRSEVARVAATFTSGDGIWTTVELISTNGTDWTATLPKDVNFFIQAVDRAGNVAIADQKGSYYTSTYSSIFLPMVRR